MMNSYELDQQKIEIMFNRITKLVKDSEANIDTSSKLTKGQLVEKIANIIETEVEKCY